jgi:hypothetical protein
MRRRSAARAPVVGVGLPLRGASGRLDPALRYFYFVFLSILLIDRANRDDERCARKYGEAWQEYRRLVPYRILPGVY